MFCHSYSNFMIAVIGECGTLRYWRMSWHTYTPLTAVAGSLLGGCHPLAAPKACGVGTNESCIPIIGRSCAHQAPTLATQGQTVPGQLTHKEGGVCVETRHPSPCEAHARGVENVQREK